MFDGGHEVKEESRPKVTFSYNFLGCIHSWKVATASDGMSII